MLRASHLMDLWPDLLRLHRCAVVIAGSVDVAMHQGPDVLVIPFPVEMPRGSG